MRCLEYGGPCTTNFVAFQPERVILPSGRQYEILYDDADALRSVITPTGTAYSYHLIMSIGCYKLKVALPADKVALMVRPRDTSVIICWRSIY
jgi:hypothetical protein